MSKTKIIFQGADDTRTELNQLSARYFVHDCDGTIWKETIEVLIEETDVDHDYNKQVIYLDRQTAINLVKQLKREIGKMEVLK